MWKKLTGVLKEQFSLLWINLKVRSWSFWEYLRVIFRYYRHLKFAQIDASLLLAYVFTNPFRMSKRFLEERGEQEIYAYGETPLTTMDWIVQQCGITSSDVVVELGCGRGRACFWLNQMIGCKCIGIDFIPAFIRKGEKIKSKFQLNNIEFRLEDIFQIQFDSDRDLKEATVVYLYGTCFSSEQIELLIDRLKKCRKGMKVITVSYSLQEYENDSSFKLLKVFPATFSWGKTEVYLQLMSKAHG